MEGETAPSRTVPQKLFPSLISPPAWLRSVTVVPSGDLSVTTRSPTQVWSMPTLVSPIPAEQLPDGFRSKEKVTFAIVPERPATGRLTLTPAGSLSGIGTAGAVYEIAVGVRAPIGIAMLAVPRLFAPS